MAYRLEVRGKVVLCDNGQLTINLDDEDFDYQFKDGKIVTVILVN